MKVTGNVKTTLLVIVAGIILVLSLTTVVYAGRYVIVNGDLLDQGEIDLLDNWHCGYIPNGNYWLEYSTGIWGYAGNPRPMGHIQDNCRGAKIHPDMRRRLGESIITPWDLMK
jgi:hypothetical protein